MPKHRSRITVRSDYTNYWSLKIWRNPNKKFQIVRCSVCNPQYRINVKKIGRIYELDSD